MKIFFIFITSLLFLFNASGVAVFASVQDDFEGANEEMEQASGLEECIFNREDCGSYSSSPTHSEVSQINGCLNKQHSEYLACLQRNEKKIKDLIGQNKIDQMMPSCFGGLSINNSCWQDDQAINEEIEDTLDEAIKNSKIPSAEEEALETPWIDPVDIILLGGGLARLAISKIVSKIAGKEAVQKASQKMVDVYHYFFKTNSAGQNVTGLIEKNGIKTTIEGWRLGGREGVYVTTLSPDKFTKFTPTTLGLKKGIGNEIGYVKMSVPADSLSNSYLSKALLETGARKVNPSNVPGMFNKLSGKNYFKADFFTEVGSFTPQKFGFGEALAKRSLPLLYGGAAFLGFYGLASINNK